MDVNNLQEAKKVILEQNNLLNKILENSNLTGIAIKKITEDRWLIGMDGNLQTATFNYKLKIEPGVSVSILKNEDSVAIVALLPEVVHHGIICKVREILPDPEGRILIESKGEKIKVFPGRFDSLKEGDDVFVYANILITGIYQSTKPTTPETGISWDDIGGLQREKDQMREIIENPIEHKELYLDYNQKVPKGVLLYGPPGNGKTMLGKALATSLSKFYKTNVNSFFYIKGPELLSQYVGVAEESIRNLFASARSFYAEHGFPPVIFLDEAESILSRRGSGKSSDIEKTIVPQFLTEMDGISESNVIVVLASNRPDMLDSAILREGRIDKKIRIDNPNIETARSIISLNLNKTKLAEGSQIIENAFVDEIFSDKYPLYRVFSDIEEEMILNLSDITSGATLANIVSSSIGNALKRDIRSGVKKAKGVCVEDAIYAIQIVIQTGH